MIVSGPSGAIPLSDTLLAKMNSRKFTHLVLNETDYRAAARCLNHAAPRRWFSSLELANNRWELTLYTSSLSVLADSGIPAVQAAVKG